MLTTPTVEIRWFDSGSISEKLKQWFDKDGLGSILGGFPETREDLYLVIPESDRDRCQTASRKIVRNKIASSRVGN